MIIPIYKKHSFIFLLAWTLSTACQDLDWLASPYFDTKFLVQYEKVHTMLCNDGFQDIAIKSIDGYILDGMYRKRDNARCNIILCAGFYPGRKEGMASFIELLPHDCNIVLLDARGHGNSQGPFWSTMPWYGQNEYKDIIGALDFVCADNQLPNILLGVCIGAFHCAHTALFLEKSHTTKAYNLQGIVFDSGFGSIADLMWVPTMHINEKTLPGLFTQFLYTSDDKRMVKQRILFKMTAFLTTLCAHSITLAMYPFLHRYDSQTNLFDKIHTLTIPILYIHSKNDHYAPLADIEKLVQKTRLASFWCLDHSEHACHQLKHSVLYREHLLEFINNSLHT